MACCLRPLLQDTWGVRMKIHRLPLQGGERGRAAPFGLENTCQGGLSGRPCYQWTSLPGVLQSSVLRTSGRSQSTFSEGILKGLRSKL